MRYGTDIDGVLADFGAEVVKIGNRLWPGKFPPEYRASNWEYDDVLTKEDWEHVMDAIKSTPHFWERLSNEPGLEDLRLHAQESDEIYCITARATTVGDSPLVQSARWLNSRGLWPRGGFSTVIPVADPMHKVELFRGLGLKFMLDDYAPTVEQLNQLDGVKAYVLDQPWNRYAVHLPRVFSVLEYLTIVHQSQ